MAQLPRRHNWIALEMMESCARRRARQKRRGYLGMSEIGNPCERALWLGFRGFSRPPLPGRIQRIFEAGDDCEQRVIRDLIEAGFTVEGCQDEYVDHGGFFRGHNDGKVYGVTKRPHILEVKSANGNRFRQLKKVGYQSWSETYYTQTQCYMGYEGFDRALVVVENKDNSDLYTERLYFEPETFLQLKVKALRIITSNDIPEAAYKAKSKTCQWCDFKTFCAEPERYFLMPGDCICGTCHYMGFRPGTCNPWCRHPDHPYQIKDVSLSCPDWSDQLKKPLPGHTLGRPHRVTWESVN
jgi:hypothetical protein